MSILAVSIQERQRRLSVALLGRLCLWAGLLGALSGVVLAAWPAAVDTGHYSYPLAATGFVLAQGWFVVQRLGLLAGLVGLGRSGAASSQRFRLGARFAVGGMVLLTLTELLAMSAAGSSSPSARTSALDTLYGISSIAIGLGLLAAGAAVARARSWRGSRRWLPLALGAYVFVPMTPLIASGFLPARLAITGWMLLFALLGRALVREVGS